MSDFVKLGFQMRQMLKFLQKQGLNDAYVLGILVEGFCIKTYYVDAKGRNIFRMIQLSKARLISDFREFGSLPLLFKTIVQLKNLAATLGRRIQNDQLEQAKGKRKGSSQGSEIKSEVKPSLFGQSPITTTDDTLYRFGRLLGYERLVKLWGIRTILEKQSNYLQDKSDEMIHTSKFKVGDIVYMKDIRRSGKSKVDPIFSPTEYKIIAAYRNSFKLIYPQGSIFKFQVNGKHLRKVTEQEVVPVASTSSRMEWEDDG
ncbi:uncharacterized protein BX664DRAFT_41633 [Halteromyces radiatus]|uniref:uncharacterized protein n=1 Tax=Halteromyces radiatus TaxID=101107 RepID=UPI002220856A|nr:uncharacterized protein BX664DRAFT_41633 [Halteromyces radiatus]KAI8077669.1 hypothetical protein BX664DRAFT_41633 [Halteromyces radiatus]